tara:strand:+ start:4287 stop:4448 length:162 start_codon:yes stop_codon:yes gene_type:complete
MADRFFKKPNGVIIKAEANHDIKSLEDRFEECGANGKALPKKETKKKIKKAKK